MFLLWTDQNNTGPEEWEQGQINEAVTCECECEQAQAYAKAKERKDKAKKRVNELFGGGARKSPLRKMWLIF